MRAIPLIAATLVALAGCSSTPDKPDVPVSTNKAIRAVCIGIRNVDPDAYEGRIHSMLNTETLRTTFVTAS
jgi:hypothetical protein